MFNLTHKFWGNDGLIGIATGLVLVLIAQLQVLQPLEKILYDWSTNYSHRDAGEAIAVIAIDDNSLAQLGDLPWSRTLYAQMLDLLAPHARVIGMTLDLSQKQPAIQPAYLDDLMAFYHHSKPLQALPNHTQEMSTFLENYGKTRGNKQLTDLLAELPMALATLEKKMQTAAQVFDSDYHFASRLTAANKVILGMPVKLGQTSGSLPALHDDMLKFPLQPVDTPPWPQPWRVVEMRPPVTDFTKAALGVAPMPQYSELSRIPLVVRYSNHYMPTLPLLMVAISRQFTPDAVKLSAIHGLRLGSVTIPVDNRLQIAPVLYHRGLAVDSFAEVLAGRIAPEKYRDKIVLLGMTATRYHPHTAMPPLLVTAHTVASLLKHEYLLTPPWTQGLHIVVILGIVAYLSGLLPHLKWRVAVASSAGILLTLVIASVVFIHHGLAIPLGLPLLLVPCGHLALYAKRAIVAYQDAFRLHPDAVESNRLLGLAFQGQGQLDMAFAKFRLCPPDEAILGLLYNLALDYEMKRQYRGAAAVYRYLSYQQPNYRDIEKRLERLHYLKKNPTLGHHFINGWLLEDTLDKPTLGRYQIEKQIGKGAMGIVYLGNDPKLNRLVAIKTLPLSQEFDDEALHEATTRFFREAAAAGRLTHPHIISIYDAGEEHDLAYISMEYFKGGNLVPYTRPDNLLPLDSVSQIVSHIAAALHYAHEQGVVHRDIKPANIMYNPANNEIKITDFGIARITDSNKTKTGIILGTPSYMSPEQLAGKVVDGRSDLFSLGVLLFQLLAGVLPFQGDSLATLMFKIANESHLDIASVRSDISPALKRIVDTALQKDVKERYQNGMQFAQALQDCVRPSGHVATPTLRDERNLICA